MTAHLILVGLPGVGKSTVGRAAAARLGRPFLDFDEEIERREGMSIARIFAERGEPYFRELERRLTEELRVAAEAMILAPGGGWAAQGALVSRLRPPATLVYLRTSPASALDRLGVERESRPLLRRPDPLAELERLLHARKAAYEAADLVIETEPLSLQGVIDRLAALAAPLG